MMTLLEVLLKNSQDFILCLHSSGRILHCNPSLQASLRGHDTVVGQSFEYLSKNHPEFLPLFEQVKRVGFTAAQLKLAWGEFFVLWSLHPFQYNGDLSLCLYGKINAREALQPNSELTFLMEKQRAEIAEEAQANFLAMVSHELRTPLYGILGTTELLLNKTVLEVDKEPLRDIYQSGNQLLGLVNDILDFTCLSQGKMKIRQESFDLFSLSNAAIVEAKRLSTNKAVSIDCYYDETLAKQVVGDALRVRQIIDNLLSNALKFTEEGKIEIWVNRLEETESRVCCHFAVKDTGIGIAKEDLDRIFDRFTQLEVIQNRRYQGTGLGLSICEQLVRIMGGRIGVESELDQGAMFWVELPFGKETLTKSLPTNRASEKSIDKKLKILLVEDNLLNQKITRLLLEDLGCEVTVVDQGQVAFTTIMQQSFDLVLMDLGLPDMSGLEVSQALLSQSCIPNTPIIAISAHATEVDKQNCLMAGMRRVLVKPVTQQDLEQLLLEFF